MSAKPKTFRYPHNLAATTKSTLLRDIRDPANQSAWERFFNQYSGFIYALSRQGGLMPDEADDNVQNVMKGLVEKMPTFEYDRKQGKFRNWLGQMTLWRAGDIRRKRAGGPDGMPPAPASTPAEINAIIEAEWRQTVLDAALKKLRDQVDPVHFAVFYASEIEEWETDKTAKTYSVSRANLYQIRRRVKKLFDKIYAEAEKEMDGGSCSHSPGF